MAIKELQARHATPRDKPYKLADGEGLFLLVKPNGAKLWRMKYRFAGKEKLLSFGAYPEIGLTAARELRLKARHTLVSGEDPMADMARPTAREGKAFDRIAKLWHENRVASLNTAHATRVWSRMEHDILPVLGPMHIEEITAPDVLAMIRQIEARGALDISRRAKQCVGQVFQFAIASGWAKADPTTHLRGALKPKPRVQHMSRLPVADLPHFLAKLNRYTEENPRRSEISLAARSISRC